LEQVEPAGDWTSGGEDHSWLHPSSSRLASKLSNEVEQLDLSSTEVLKPPLLVDTDMGSVVILRGVAGITMGEEGVLARGGLGVGGGVGKGSLSILTLLCILTLSLITASLAFNTLGMDFSFKFLVLVLGSLKFSLVFLAPFMFLLILSL